LVTLTLVLLASIPVYGHAALNVSIVIFDPGVPEDRSVHRDLQIFPRIREIEARILPFVLRDTLAGTGEWGAVRVIPEPDVSAELLVTGEIGRSDGEMLELRIRAVDASGVVWLDKAFAGAVNDGQYDAVAAELRSVAAQLDENRLDGIRDFSMLRYAYRLAPSVFGDYLETQEDGTVKLIRLPARSDPNLDRIRRMRETEYVITDTVDAKFQELHADIASVYELWRKYRRKNLEYQASNAEQAQATKSAAPKGSFEDLKAQYDNYKWDRVTAQEQDRLAVAFSNEASPKIEAIETRIAELTAWVDQRYALWNRLMAELFDVETTLQEADVLEKELIERIETLPRGEIE
jgi:hypothetical protein